ncbi:uncharacterized protein [Antedon mediterranea]|uniref:uncharacterized protein n=1 Tax=Antedon mediterranea TaxID=105859 RepID=UPI003AF79E37
MSGNQTMLCVWNIKLILFILIELVRGNTMPLECYNCSNYQECVNATTTSCSSGQDACVTVALWEGDDHRDMRISKRCDSLNVCPRGLVNGSATHCENTDVFKCIMCCTENYCNGGAIGHFPQPPKVPPIPEYKLEQCADSVEECKTTTNVENDVIYISKICDTFIPMGRENKNTSDINHCNVEDKTDLCVTCCNRDCYNNSKNVFDTTNYSIKITLHKMLAYLCLAMVTVIRR